MQAPTHILTGVLIEKIVNKYPELRFKATFIITGGIVSHILLDKFARLTYHSPKALWKDLFWLVYHASLLFATIISLRYYWKDYKLGIISAIIPDFDWIFFRPITTFFPSIEVFKEPVLHRFFETILSYILPLKLLDGLPNWTLRRETVIIEGVLVILLFVGIRKT